MDVKKVTSCDIAIVGGGNAGLIAAIEATDLGAGVLLLEKAPRSERGGNSRLSGGRFRFACDRGTKDCEPLLKGSTLPREEIEIEPYTKDAFYGDLMKVSGGLAEKKWTEVIVNESLPTMVWLTELGFKWDLNFAQAARDGNRLFWAAGNTVLLTWNEGEGLIETLYGIAEARKVPVLYETAAQSLIVNADGKVCGVIAKSREGMIQINAGSVVLASGGFEGNREMRRRYLGEGWDLVKLRGTRYNTGDGLRMALEIGAQPFGHWGGCHASVVSEDSPEIEADATGAIRYSYLYGIMVNTNGERFVDEGEDFANYTYAKLGKEIAKQPGGVAFQIFDSKIIPVLRPEYQDAVRVESDSLEDLASQIEVDRKTFINTVDQFNNAVSEERPFLFQRRDGRRTYGLDPDKTNWSQKIDTPPFVAYAVVCGLTFTYGGLKINEKTQVIDVSDRPIEGLYAIGELPGGLFYHNYPSGSGLMKGVITARIAAAHAVGR